MGNVGVSFEASGVMGLLGEVGLWSVKGYGVQMGFMGCRGRLWGVKGYGVQMGFMGIDGSNGV